MTRYLSIKTKIYLLTTLLVVFSALITFSLHVHQIWQETEEQQFQQLKSLTTLLDSTLENFDTNSSPIKSEDTHPKNAQVSQKVLFLNQSLQPRIDTLLSAFPDFGAGFYGKSLNSILAFGPGFTSTGLKDIRSSSKARIVYKTRKPYRFSVYSQIRKTQIIAIIHPIIRNDQVIGHVWANVPQAGFHTIFFAALEKQLPLFFIIVMVGFFTSHLVVGRFQKNLAILLKRVKQRKLTRDDSKLFSGELLEIYSEVSTAYNQISDSEKRFKDVVIAFDEMIWETDTLGCYTYLSREDQHLYRNHTISENIANHPAPKNYIGHSCFDLLIPEDRAIIKSAFMTALEGGQPFLDLEFRCKNSRGEIRWYKSSAVPIKTVTGDVLGMRGATRDITQSKQQEEQIRHLAYHDVLTGLPNRLDFMQTLASLISRNDTVAVFFIDIDRFKTLNDSLGHPFGDDILRSVAKHLTKQLPEKALLSRFGGDEFLLTVPNCSQEESEHIADKLIRSFHHQPIIAKERSINLTISIGIALSPVHGHQSETLVKNADVALYQAKQAGRDGYRCCESSMTEEARLKLELEHDLREALEQQQLYLVYQPQVNPETGDVLGVEALIRWHHPEKGVISPFHFIPLAEESQLIIPIGNWVLKQACTQAKQWLDDGYPVKMAVNVSSIQFNQDDYIEQVQETLRLTGLPAHWLELEITESVAVKHLDWVKSRLDALKKLGINLALDDFGTGFSSLSYLKQFPIDKLKIDRAFITDICHSNDEAVMAQAILQMAHGLGMKVVAEGVEEPAQLSFLVKRDCQLIQGYFYSPPVESDDCLQLIRQGFKATPSEHPIEYMI